MTTPDFRGARGSNAGDDFHELWAVRQSLELLNWETDLAAITVEGLRPEDELLSPVDMWDGVDCAFYFGGDNLNSATRIIIDQLKYSASNPDQNWTVARLTHSTNQRKDNSVIGRLAKAYLGIKQSRSDLITSGKLTIRLISNQSIDPAVRDAFSGVEEDSSQEDRRKIIDASGLNYDDFAFFSGTLDFSQCGHESRLALEESILTAISGWTDDDARTWLTHLMGYVRRRMMMPEGKGEFINQHTLLSQLGFSDPRALYPCESAIQRINHIVRRESLQTIKEDLVGSPRICIHGEAGCGKTTALQEIESLLPNGSCIIKYDCYGGGRYLDSDAYRHRPQDAFLQLSNDLARQLHIPYLLTRSKDVDYPKAFKKRLEKAAEIVALKDQTALLVIVVDAADNAVTAANMQVPPERSFLQDFLTLGDLPSNVRLVVTARTGRLPELNLPPSFQKSEISGFTQSETTDHVRQTSADMSETWLADFHYLSGGNPRVQNYALRYAGERTELAINYLRPNGKDLGQIFQEQLSLTRQKVGNSYDIKRFCSGLIALPRPIPIAALAVVTDLSISHIQDLCSDLAPGTRVENGMIGFADEDFEDFIRSEAETQLSQIRNKIADYFVRHHLTNAYAAMHLASALLAAGRKREIIDLITRYLEPEIIRDPVLRKNVRLQRLRIAMKVCRETGNNIDAMLVLLRGAEALKTNNAIHRMLVDNPDLTASFARYTAAPDILRNPKDIEKHGPLLFHMMAADARDGNAISVREEHRQLHAWLSRRKDSYDDQQQDHPQIRPQGWSIDDVDIAAEIEALLRMNGPEHALASLYRWHPRMIAVSVAKIISHQLIISGEISRLDAFRSESQLASPWDLFLLIPLALAGKSVDIYRIESGLRSLIRRKLISFDKLGDSWQDKDSAAEFLDILLTACELCIAHNGNRESILSILKQITDTQWRRRDKLFTSDLARIDLGLRAFCLLERLQGRQPTLETYWLDPPDLPTDPKSKGADRIIRSDNEKKEELKSFIGPLIDIYDVRAQAFTGLIPVDDVNSAVQKAIGQYRGQDYLYSRSPYSTRMKARVALSTTYLMLIPGLELDNLLNNVTEALGPASLAYSKYQMEVWGILALRQDLHPAILRYITARVQDTKKMKISAEEKMNELLLLSRSLLPINYHDAESVFNDAHEVASEIDVETTHEIRLFSPLAESASLIMSIEQQKSAAQNLAIIISDAGIRLSGYDHFPWQSGIQSLALLNVSVALAAVSRWEDQNLVDRDTTLPPVLQTALSRHELTAKQITALLPLIDDLGEEFMVVIAEQAILENTACRATLVEYLARDELLRFGKGSREKFAHKLKAVLGEANSGYWTSQLFRTVSFHHTARHQDMPTGAERSSDTIDTSAQYGALFAEFVLAMEHPCSVEYLMSTIRTFLQSSQSGSSRGRSSILEDIRKSISPRNQVNYLEALGQSESSYLLGYEIALELVMCLKEWQGSLSVIRWRQERLLDVVTNHLLEFSRWISFGEDYLQSLLAMVDQPNNQITSALLGAIERHVDEFDSRTLYGLIGIVSSFCTPEENAQVLERFSNQLLQRIHPADRESWDISDIPNDTLNGVTRFIYALMSDIDVRIRWRAVHALRRFANLGDTTIIDGIIGLYDKTSEISFRRPDAPFYWLATRLWLMMAADRIASETPLAVSPHYNWLLSIATDKTFPHLLVRAFAKSALTKLVENGFAELDKTQRILLDKSNTSQLRRKKQKRRYGIDFSMRDAGDAENRRFRFNSMDTLPYWYEPATRVFAEMDAKEFLDTAERWIVDNWKITNNPWMWTDEPRNSRITDRTSLLAHNGHGSRPVIDRFHTYLEWHAMWCAVGELIQTHPLAKLEEADLDNFEYWLSHDGLSLRPWWLADFHGPKPLEDQLWSKPTVDIDEWVDTVGSEQFFAELGLQNDDDFLIIGSSKDVRSSSFKQSTKVRTALVSPETSDALVRALQTVQDSWDYVIPTAGGGNEINEPPYRLNGWLVHGESKSGLDREDPFRYGVDGIELAPAEHICEVLNLQLVFENSIEWIDVTNRNTVFLYNAWGDNRGDEREENFRYDMAVRSYGWQLKIDKQVLIRLLNALDADLIVEVEIERGNEGYDYSRHDQEKTKKSRFDKIILLKKNGTIETADGHLGTWQASSTRTGV